jgi:hypothetical protein
MVLRIASHVAVWLVVAVPLIVVLSKGWVATADDAAIAIRSHQVLTLHPPLVGLASNAAVGSGQYLHDPGPLLFWLLAIPVRIDPTHGPLWGAALLGGVALSVAIEAAWSTRRWLGCVLIAFAAVDYLWLVPLVFENLIWNAYFPIPFLIATVVLAWVVGSGSIGWWPVLVFVGSVAAQTHLIYTIPTAVLVLSAPLVAVAMRGRPQRLRWLVFGVLAGAVCWLAPLIQNFGSDGNLSALASSDQGQKSLGFAFGLRVVAFLGSPPPLWLRHEPSNFYSVVGSIDANATVVGFLVLFALAVIALFAWRHDRQRLCVLSLVAFVSCICTAISFSIIPNRNVLSVDYVISFLWALSILVWTVAVWAAVLLGSALFRRRTAVEIGRPSPLWRAMTGWVAIGVVAIIGFVGVASLRTFVPSEANVGLDSAGFSSVKEIAKHIERSVPPGPVVIRVTALHADDFYVFDIEEGVAWQLEADGWKPGLYSSGEQQWTGLVPSPNSSAFFVTVDPQRVVSIRRVRCPPLSAGCLDLDLLS